MSLILLEQMMLSAVLTHVLRGKGAYRDIVFHGFPALERDDLTADLELGPHDLLDPGVTAYLGFEDGVLMAVELTTDDGIDATRQVLAPAGWIQSPHGRRFVRPSSS